MEAEAIKLIIPSNPKFLGLARGVAYALATATGFGAQEAKDLQLAINEACANVIQHSYEGRIDQEIVLTFHLHEDKLQILIKDFGRKVDPVTIKSRDLDDIKPGGLGVFLIETIMDEVQYDMSGKAGPELRMVKYRKKGAKGGDKQEK